ncbi:MAG: hypothetical protein E6J06_11275 [Chloroflexi bacterium]|nr:MAG: hypothetical protein E6J06_11275 [Chloroflexota bacterium]
MTIESTCSALASRNRSAALRSDSTSRHADLPGRQLELADAVEQRPDKCAPTHDHLDALVARRGHHLAALIAHFRPAGTGDDQGLVGAGNVIAAGDERDEQDEDDDRGDH